MSDLPQDEPSPDPQQPPEPPPKPTIKTLDERVTAVETLMAEVQKATGVQTPPPPPPPPPPE